jgi:hypothetical protein
MILLKTDSGLQIFVLEPDNIDDLKAGGAQMSPFGDTIIAYSPDIKWTLDQLTEMLKTCAAPDAELITFILTEGAKRPEVRR